MKFYLSSYKIGNEAERLKRMFSVNKRVGYVPNATDYTNLDLERQDRHIKRDIADLQELGLIVEMLDLREYFGRKEELENRLEKLGGIWVTGGSVFILRQAMELSGLDGILKKWIDRKDFVYGGYSAAGCVLSPNLHAYEIVDNAKEMPYPQLKSAIWEGLDMIDYAFMPHYGSDHQESDDIDKEIEYCKENKIPYKTLQDGEVIIIE